MVHWLWLIVSAMFGGVVSIIAIGAVVVGSEGYKRTEADRGKKV